MVNLCSKVVVVPPPRVATIWPKSGQRRSGSGLMCRNRANLGRLQAWPNLAGAGPMSVEPKLNRSGQIRPIVNRVRSNPGQCWLMLADVGTTLVEFGGISNSNQFGRIRPILVGLCFIQTRRLRTHSSQCFVFGLKRAGRGQVFVAESGEKHNLRNRVLHQGPCTKCAPRSSSARQTKPSLSRRIPGQVWSSLADFGTCSPGSYCPQQGLGRNQGHMEKRAAAVRSNDMGERPKEGRSPSGTKRHEGEGQNSWITNMWVDSKHLLAEVGRSRPYIGRNWTQLSTAGADLSRIQPAPAKYAYLSDKLSNAAALWRRIACRHISV